jgi:hypothetical protein
MTPDALLARLAGTLRGDICPEVADPFARTQAFMAAVILEKLAAQLRMAADHDTAGLAACVALAAELAAEDGLPTAVSTAVESLASGREDALAPLVSALHASRRELGEERFARLLARVRLTLRARVDRQLAYAA